jgi:hypothetical protein
VTDKRGDFAVGDTKGDGRVDTGSKRRDSILEKVTDDLHDCRLVLDDGDIGRMVELTGVS